MPSEDLEAFLSRANSVCVLTGAGISQESGVPTFRGEEGLWRKYRAEDLGTPEAFARDPLLVWEWYAWRREIMHQAQPNAGHLALAELQEHFAKKPGCRFTLVTQNTDGLHQRAGSRYVVCLHGNIWTLCCSGCGEEREDHSVPLEPFPPRCSCSALMRPAVVWFGEPLPMNAWREAEDAARCSDLFLVIGTSGLVYPAAWLPQVAKERGAQLVEINPFPTALSESADLVIRAKAAEVLGPLREKIHRL